MWKEIRRNYRRAVAAALTAVMTFINVFSGTNVVFAAGEREESLFLIDGSELQSAIEDAKESGKVFDLSSLDLQAGRKRVKNQYTDILGDKKGDVYELDVEVDDSYALPDTGVAVFYNEGTDQVIFLFANGSDMVADFVANVGGYETEPVMVAPNTNNVETDDEEDPDYALNYEEGDMVDDTSVKVKPSLIPSMGVGGTGSSKEDKETVDSADEKNGDETDTIVEEDDPEAEEEEEDSEISEEAKDKGADEEEVEEAEDNSGSDEEEAEDNGSVDEEEAEDADTEDEAGTDDEGSDGDEAEPVEISLSRHVASVVALSQMIPGGDKGGFRFPVPSVKDEDKAEETKETVEETETEEESESEEEIETEDETKSEDESEPEDESKPEDESEPEDESKPEDESEPEDETEAPEDNGGVEDPEDDSKADEPEKTPEAGDPEKTPEVTESENKETDKPAEAPETGKPEETPKVNTGAVTIPAKEKLPQKLEDLVATSSDATTLFDKLKTDDDLEMIDEDEYVTLGTLKKGKVLDTVTVLESLNVGAYVIKMEDLEAAFEADGYEIEYPVYEDDTAIVTVRANSGAFDTEVELKVEPITDEDELQELQEKAIAGIDGTEPKAEADDEDEDAIIDDMMPDEEEAEAEDAETAEEEEATSEDEADVEEAEDEAAEDGAVEDVTDIEAVEDEAVEPETDIEVAEDEVVEDEEVEDEADIEVIEDKEAEDEIVEEETDVEIVEDETAEDEIVEEDEADDDEIAADEIIEDEAIEDENVEVKADEAEATHEILVAYDVTFYDVETGEEVEPSKPISVTITLKEAVKLESAEDQAEKAAAAENGDEAAVAAISLPLEDEEPVYTEVSLVHLPKDGEAEVVTSSEGETVEELSMETESLSPFVLMLSQNNYAISTIANLPGSLSFKADDKTTSGISYNGTNCIATISKAGTLTVSGTYNGSIVINGGTVSIVGMGTIDAEGQNTSAITISGANTKVTLDGDITVTGGTGTEIQNYNMEPRNDYKFRVGGGVYVDQGATFNLVSGTISGNTAQRGGGIFVGISHQPSINKDGKPVFKEDGKRSSFAMSGGAVTGNSTVGDSLAGEGGGIFVWGIATISGGTISNNICNSTTDLGGGGLYINNGGIATLINAKITNNTAEGFGGGIAGCCHGEMSSVATDGAALYGNTANGNNHTMEDGAKGAKGVAEIIDHWNAAHREGIKAEHTMDFYTAGSSIISNYMAGGGSANYAAKFGSDPVHEVSDDEVITKVKTDVGLVAHPSDESKENVPDGVTISGNSSNVHGGGIGCNGGLYFGSVANQRIEFNVLDITLKAKKTLAGAQLSKDQYEFELVYDDDDTVAAKAKNDASGNITFHIEKYTNTDNLESHIKDNTITFRMREVVPQGSTDVTYDKSEYKLVVSLKKEEKSKESVTLDHTTDSNKTFNKLTVTYITYVYKENGKTITRVKDQNGNSVENEETVGEEALIFTNYVNAGYKPKVQKVIAGDFGMPTSDETFKFQLSSVGNSPMPKDDGLVEVTVSVEGSAEFGGIVYERPGTYMYTIKEIPGNNDVYTYDHTVWTLTVTVDDNMNISHSYTATGKAPSSEKATFTNTYIPTPTEWELGVKKFVVGSDPLVSSRQFDFNLTGNGIENSKGVTMPAETHVGVVAGAGPVYFGEITFTMAGSYTFTVAEKDPNVLGYTGGTPKSQEITVKVEDDHGRLKVSEVTAKEEDGFQVTLNGDPDPLVKAFCNFTNTFHYTSTTWTPSVLKMMEYNGYEIPETYRKDFTFTIVQNEDDEIKVDIPENGTVTAVYPYDSNISFGDITFTEPGDYHFTVSETNDGYTGYTYDETVYNVTVEVDSEDDGQLSKKVTVDKTEGRFTAGVTSDKDTYTFVFTNSYKPDSTNVLLNVKKHIDAPHSYTYPEDVTFRFALEEQLKSTGKYTMNRLVETKDITLKADDQEAGVNPGITDDEVSFSELNYEKTGEYTYYIRELGGDLPGFSYDNTVWTVKVEVVDVGGQLQPEISYTSSQNPDKWDKEDGDTAEFMFTNAYDTTKVSYSPKVFKRVDGEPVAKDTTFTFNLEEILETSGRLTLSKVIQSQKLTLSAGQSMGYVNFDDIEYEEPGTYQYLIKEVKPEDADTNYKGYTFDETVWKLTVKIVDVKGALQRKLVTYEKLGSDEIINDGFAAFFNQYAVTETKLSAGIHKEIKGDPIPAGQNFTFEFEISADEQEGMELPENTGLSVTVSSDNLTTNIGRFNDITFKKAGVYNLKITERDTNKIPGYTYDTTGYDMEVTVEDKDSQLTITEIKLTKDGQVVKDVGWGDGPAEGPVIDNTRQFETVFTNVYDYGEASYQPEVSKAFTGASRPTDKEFTFEIAEGDYTPPANALSLSLGNGLVMPESKTVTVTGEGTAKFDEIKFTNPGTYNFTITEVKGTENGYTYDETQWNLEVVVEDVNGKLTVTKNTYTNGTDTRSNDSNAAFINDYQITETTAYVPAVKKTVLGNPLEDEEFYFTMESGSDNDADGFAFADENGKDASVRGAGTTYFGGITFKKAGTYTFTIKETGSNSPFWHDDDRTWTLTVVVEDQDSQLVVTGHTYVRDGEDSVTSDTEAEFENEYHGPGDLSIAKTVSGNRGERTRAFNFTVTLTNAEGKALAGTYEYAGSSTIEGVEAPVDGVVENGVLNITLAHGQMITIKGVPSDTKYEVTEAEADADDYRTTVEIDGEAAEDVATGEIVRDKEIVVEYLNYRNRTDGDDDDDNPGGGGNPGGGNPGGGNPGGGNPGGPGENTPVTINDEGVPLASLPEEQLVTIPEEETPLAALLPKTGDSRNMAAWLMMFGIAGIGMLGAAIGLKKSKEEED